MKKIFVLLLAALILSSMLALNVSAQTYNPSSHCSTVFELKKADPACVIKDGIIGDGEYEKLALDLSLDTSDLNLSYTSPAGYISAEEVLPTVEFYFSWDEIHGFNMAMRFKPTEASCHQVMDIAHDADGIPKDDFLTNVGFLFAADQTNPRQTADECPFFFYTLAKRTDNGEYLEGHYNQLGIKGYYDPTPEVDYTISYEAGGTVLCEWSIPFDNFIEDPCVGQTVFFSASMSSGESTDNNVSNEEKFASAYSVSLGDYGYLVDQRVISLCKNAEAVISDELIAADNGQTSTDGTMSADTDDAPDTAKPDDTTSLDTADGEKENDPPKTDGKETGSEPSETKENDVVAPSTGDPMIASAAAVLVCSGALLIIRKKH